MVLAPMPINATSAGQAEPNSTESRLLSLMDDMRSLRLFVKEEINDVDCHLKQRKALGSNQHSGSMPRYDDETTTTMTADLSRNSSSTSSYHTGTEPRKRRPTFVSVQRKPSEGSIESPLPKRSTCHDSPTLSSKSSYTVTVEPTHQSYRLNTIKASPLATKPQMLSSSRHVSEPITHSESTVRDAKTSLLRRICIDDDLPQPNKPLRRQESARGLQHEPPSKPLRRDVSTRALDHSTAHLQDSLMKMANMLLAKTAIANTCDDTCDDTFCTLDSTDFGPEMPLDMYMKKESEFIPPSKTNVGVVSVCSDLKSMDQSPQVCISNVDESHRRPPPSTSLLRQISIDSSDMASSPDRCALPLVSKPIKESQRRHSDSRSQQSRSNERGRNAESFRLHLANLETDAYRAEQGVMGDISKRAKATSVRVSQRRVNSQRNLKKARDSSSQQTFAESVVDSKSLDVESDWADFDGARFQQSWQSTMTIEPAAAKKYSAKPWHQEEDVFFPEDSMSDWNAGSFAADFLAPVNSESPRRFTERGLKEEQLHHSLSSTNRRTSSLLPMKVSNVHRESKVKEAFCAVVSTGDDDNRNLTESIDAFGFLSASSDSHSDSGETMLLDFSARSDSVATAPANDSVYSSVAYDVDAMTESYVMPSVASRSVASRSVVARSVASRSVASRFVTTEASAFAIGGDAGSRPSLFDLSMPPDILRSPGKEPTERPRHEDKLEERRPTLAKLFAENPAIETAIDNISFLKSDQGSHDGTCIDMIVEDSKSVGSVSALTYIVPSNPWNTCSKGPLTYTVPLKNNPPAFARNLAQVESSPDSKEIVRDLQNLKSSVGHLQRIDLTLRKAMLDKEDEAKVKRNDMMNLIRKLTMEEISLRKINEKRNASKLRLKTMELNDVLAAMDPQRTSHPIHRRKKEGL